MSRKLIGFAQIPSTPEVFFSFWPPKPFLLRSPACLKNVLKAVSYKARTMHMPLERPSLSLSLSL